MQIVFLYNFQEPVKKKIKNVDDPFAAFRTAISPTEVLKPSERDIFAEIRKYEATEVVVSTNELFNPLTWWGEQKFKFPTLNHVAKMILVIQASSAESERHFSTSGKIARKDRARLNPETLEAQVLLCQALKQGNIAI